ncbi:MAG: DNA methyltransferase [Caldilineaceae bacterium]|nr:DNA methyltransferase [Caldilineaceae bacterium]
MPTSVGNPNWANKTIWTGDCLYVMRGMNSASIDLIYLDPPFNSKADYAAPIGSKAAGAAFKDTWTLTDIDVEWINLIEQKHPHLYRVLLAATTKSDKSYLVYMAARLLEMQRVLKTTGSIYLHCDSTMSHYLKIVMDGIFGKQNFRSEIIWRRTNSHNKLSRKYGPIHENILFYSASDKFTFNPGRTPYTQAYIDKYFNHSDQIGPFQKNVLTGSGTRQGDSGLPWRGYDPTIKNRHWAIPKALREWLPENGAGMTVQEQLDFLYSKNQIVFPEVEGGQPRYKQRIGEGVPYQDIWAYQPGTDGTLYGTEGEIDWDVKWLDSSEEVLGYPTQKPLGLLRRIIESSSQKGDVVLDPFCGCATTCVAADDIGRNWIGIDISEKAAQLVVERIEERQGLFRDIVHRTDIPDRTDIGKVRKYNSLFNRKHLYGEQGGYCAGCQTHFQQQHLEVDHIISRKKGGTDHIGNLQLLCSYCNRTKGDRGMAYLQSRLQIAT